MSLESGLIVGAANTRYLRKFEMIIMDDRIGKEFPIPAHATHGSAAVDLVACLKDGATEISIPPETAVLIPTGVAIHIADSRYVGLICPRSGNGHKRGMVLGNGTGVIDSDYQGQLFVSVLNRNDDKELVIKAGEAIAQYFIVPVVQMDFNIVDKFTYGSERGEGGFGSTTKLEFADAKPKQSTAAVLPKWNSTIHIAGLGEFTFHPEAIERKAGDILINRTGGHSPLIFMHGKPDLVPDYHADPECFDILELNDITVDFILRPVPEEVTHHSV